MYMPFGDFFTKTITQSEGRALIGKMQALEPYAADAYSYVRTQQKLISEEEAQDVNGDVEKERKKPMKLGTLSQAEWEATNIYLVFAFQKIYESTAHDLD